MKNIFLMLTRQKCKFVEGFEATVLLRYETASQSQNKEKRGFRIY